MRNLHQGHNVMLTLFIFLILNFGNINGQDNDKIKIRFIDYFFENASILNWKLQGDSIIKISLIADYEKETLNRQTDHWHFRIDANKGTRIKLIIAKTFPDIYNGQLASNWWNFENDISCYVSYDQQNWEPIKTSKLINNELLVDFEMQAESAYVARLPVYTESNLDILKNKIKDNSLVEIIPIGHTVENKPLEIIRLGDPDAQHNIFIRARAHPWEPGGNWVIEGLIYDFLNRDTNSIKWEKSICYYILPMANKDGVFRGMTRFNIAGRDLNRNWLVNADSILSPENFAVEKFMKNLIHKKNNFILAVDFHNDDYGNIHLIQPRAGDDAYYKRMEFLHKKLIENTWFSNELTKTNKIAGGGNMADGMYNKFGIDAIIFELNANYIEKLKKVPEATDWFNLGTKLNDVFHQYLKEYIY